MAFRAVRFGSGGTKRLRTAMAGAAFGNARHKHIRGVLRALRLVALGADRPPPRILLVLADALVGIAARQVALDQGDRRDGGEGRGGSSGRLEGVGAPAWCSLLKVGE